VPTFAEKLKSLMRAHGDTTRSLGEAVGVTSAAVTGWRKNAVPRPDVARQIADHYEVSVEALLDDSRELMATVIEEPEHHLASAPLAAAAALARDQHGATAAGQAAFEKYLSTLRGMRTEAEQLAQGNVAEAVRIFDGMLASWLMAQSGSSAELEAAAKKLAALKQQAREGGHQGPPRARRHA